MDDHVIVVAVSNPQTAPRLVYTASLVAREYEGRIVVTNVVPLAAGAASDEQRAGRTTKAYELVERAEGWARNWGVPCESVVSLGEQVHEVIVDVAVAQRAELIVAGFSERDEPSLQQDEEFDRIIDALAARAPCHLLVARFRNGERFSRALVALGSERNLALTRGIVTSLHHQAGTAIDFLNFVPDADRVEGARQEVAGWLEAAGLAECGAIRVEVSDSPHAAIVEASREYDVVIVGTPPLLSLRRRLFGSAAEYVADNARCTTFLVRRHERA